MDYVVSDYEAFDNIPSLKIGKYSPWLSDHCALHFELSSEEVANDRNSFTKEKVPIQYIWGEGSRENFLKSLEENEGKLKEFDDMDIRETENLLSFFTKTVTGIADKANLKLKSRKRFQKRIRLVRR